MLRALALTVGLMLGAMPVSSHALSIVPPSASGDDVDLGHIANGERRTVIGLLGDVTLDPNATAFVNALLEDAGYDVTLPAGISLNDSEDSFDFVPKGSKVKIDTIEILNGPGPFNDVLMPEATGSTPDVSTGADLGAVIHFSGFAGQPFELVFSGIPEPDSLLVYGAEIHVTPIPGAVLLFGTAVASLAGLRYRRARRAAA